MRVGDSALFTCSYDLEDAQLYTIKWYLDEMEFYRFVPKKDPSHNTFPVRGIQVNVNTALLLLMVLLFMIRERHHPRHILKLKLKKMRKERCHSIFFSFLSAFFNILLLKAKVRDGYFESLIF